MSDTSIELFAGAGGLALGIEKAGFEHLGFWNKKKLVFFRVNSKVNPISAKYIKNSTTSFDRKTNNKNSVLVILATAMQVSAPRLNE